MIETATVNVTVDPVADGVADSFTTAEDTVLSDDVSTNDTFSAAATYSLNADASNGTVSMNANGTFTYTPDADFNGSDSFTYDVEDVNGDTETISVDLTVTPVVDIADDTVTVAEDGSTTDDLLANDSFEGSSPSITAVTQGANGTVVNNNDGTVTYTPDDDFNGTDSYEYTVTSGGVIETATVNVTVNAVADGVADSFTTAEDTVLSDDVSTNDTFSAAATYSVNTDVSNGTLVDQW
ncbi:MAG: Ig-like domain-containing protein [Gammaproteobacteria bacterium]|nr:Ig-like domain-containing protein [Gammaproteobacteria bacterium]